VEHILSKLGASRRTEIATWASHVVRSRSASTLPQPVEHASRA